MAISWTKVKDFSSNSAIRPHGAGVMAAAGDGKLWWIETGTNIAELWVYDPDANTVTHLTDPPELKAFGGAAFHDHKFYIFAGTDLVLVGASIRSRKCYVYDTVGGSWSALTDFPLDVGGATSVQYDYPACAYWDGGIFLFGIPYLGNGTLTAESQRRTYRYDIAGDSWTEKAMMSLDREGAAAVSIDGYGIFLFGGFDSDGVPYNETWLYDADADTFAEKTEIPSDGRGGYMNAGLLSDGRVVVVGTIGFTGAPKPTYVYNPALDSWEDLGITADPIGGNDLIQEEHAAGSIDGVYYASSFYDIAMLDIPSEPAVDTIGVSPAETEAVGTPAHVIIGPSGWAI